MTVLDTVQHAIAIGFIAFAALFLIITLPTYPENQKQTRIMTRKMLGAKELLGYSPSCSFAQYAPSLAHLFSITRFLSSRLVRYSSYSSSLSSVRQVVRATKKRHISTQFLAR